MVRVIVALGSNVGDRLTHLQRAVDLLKAQIELCKASHIYETAPMYLIDQPSFLNAAVLGTTDKGPLPLLALLKAIEQEVGRQARVVNGPREVDLDLISYGHLAYRYEEGKRTVLQIPHSKLAERRFVLAPVNDIAPDLAFPGLGTVTELLDKTNDQADSVVRIRNAVLHL